MHKPNILIDTLIEENSSVLFLEEIKKLNALEEADNQGRNISDEQAQQIAQGLQQGQISEDEIQQALQSGQMTEEDVQAIQQFLQQNAEQSDESQFEQELSKISDSIIRLNLYDRIQELQKKIQNIIDLETKVDNKKFEHIYNYLDILLSLVYSLDINILYQLYISLELKTIEYIKEELGLDTSEEKRLQINLEIEGEKNDLETKYTPETLPQKFALYFSDQMSSEDKKQFEDDIKKLVLFGIYTEDQMEQYKEQGQQQAQSTEQQDQVQPDESQIEQAAQSIVSGESSPEELEQMHQQGQIDDQTFQAIQQRVEELKQQGQGGQQGQDQDQDQAQDQPAQAQDQPAQAQDQPAQDQPAQAQDQDQDQAQDQAQVEQAAQAIYNGELSADELIALFKENKIDANTFNAIIEKIEQLKTQDQTQPDQSQEQTPTTPDESQIEQAAQSIVSGESSPEELEELLQHNQIDQATYDAITKRVDELLTQNQGQNQ